MNINYFMNQANKEAKKAILLDEVPIGAILVDNKDNKIIASAHNETVNKNNPIKHAELIVIEKALVNIKKKFLDSTTLFVTLEPCAMCATAISIVRISKVYFGAYDLSQSLGYPGEVNHPEVIKAIQKGVEQVNHAGKYAGGFVPQSKDDIKLLIDMGMKFITYEVDSSIILNQARDIADWFSNEI